MVDRVLDVFFLDTEPPLSFDMRGRDLNLGRLELGGVVEGLKRVCIGLPLDYWKLTVYIFHLLYRVNWLSDLLLLRTHD